MDETSQNDVAGSLSRVDWTAIGAWARAMDHRGHTTTRVYQFGLRSPIAGADLVRQRMDQGRRYYNDLVTIERERRKACRAFYSSHPEVSALESEVAAADRAVGEARRVAAEHCSREGVRTPPSHLSGAVKAAKKLRSEVRAQLGEAKRATDAMETFRRYDGAASELQRLTRGASGLSSNFGTYQMAEEDRDRMREDVMKEAGLSEDGDPRWRPWSAPRWAATHLQNGAVIPARELSGDGRWARIERVSEEAWLAAHPRRHARSPEQQRIGKRARMGAVLHLRLGSDGREPVWASFPMVMHREIPANARVTWARVRRRMIGPREVWDATITVSMADGMGGPGLRREAPSPTVEAVGVDIGWRKLGEELRVCVWSDGSGDPSEPLPIVRSSEIVHHRSPLRALPPRGELRLDAWMLGGFSKTDGAPSDYVPGVSAGQNMVGLRGVRDRDYNASLARLLAWARAEDSTALPACVREALPHMHLWRRKGRLAALAKSWRTEREGDPSPEPGAFVALQAWAYNDHHLWAWETSGREKAHRARKDAYRRFARLLRSLAGAIVWEGRIDAPDKSLDLRPLVELPDIEERVTSSVAPQQEDAARYYRRVACLSELRSCIENAGPVEKVNPTSTIICDACGVVERFDAAKEVWHQCACGVRWDQDANAARVLLGKWLRERRSGGEKVVGARLAGKDRCGEELGESKWSKKKQAKVARASESEAARKATDKAAE